MLVLMRRESANGLHVWMAEKRGCKKRKLSLPLKDFFSAKANDCVQISLSLFSGFASLGGGLSGILFLLAVTEKIRRKRRLWLHDRSSYFCTQEEGGADGTTETTGCQNGKVCRTHMADILVACSVREIEIKKKTFFKKNFNE